VKPPRVTKEEVKPLPVTKEDVKSPPETREEVKPILTDKPVVEEKKEESKPTEPEYKPSEITKNAENSTAGGIELTFIDKYADGDKDTIQILIPAKKPVLEAKKEEPKEERRFLEISADSSQVKQPVEKIPEPNAKAEQTVPANVKTKVKNNCPSTAVESDFFKLRKKMAAETNDYDMIDEARKVFKTKCFSVVQVKNLSALFLTDLGKYMFFDAFYTYVSDPENFTVLEAELKDQYYINRFRSMLRN
jgi:hypothetical protein